MSFNFPYQVDVLLTVFEVPCWAASTEIGTLTNPFYRSEHWAVDRWAYLPKVTQLVVAEASVKTSSSNSGMGQTQWPSIRDAAAAAHFKPAPLWRRQNVDPVPKLAVLSHTTVTSRGLAWALVSVQMKVSVCARANMEGLLLFKDDGYCAPGNSSKLDIFYGISFSPFHVSSLRLFLLRYPFVLFLCPWSFFISHRWMICIQQLNWKCHRLY